MEKRPDARIPRILLGVIVVALLVLAVWTPWRGVNVVDNRTYVEMVTGVRDHGLPYTENTWSDRLPESAPAFNIPRHGKLWGEYPPLYAYVAAPALALGGLSFLYKEHVIFLAILALLVAHLTTRLTSKPFAGVAAAAITVFGTPIYAGSFQTFAMPLALVLLMLFLIAAVRALDRQGFGATLLTALLGGAAMATHLIATLMVLSTLGVLAIIGSPQGRLRDLAVRAGASAIGLTIALLPVAILNSHRFGSPNPFSYGSCPWRACREYGDVRLANMVRFATPGLVFFAIVVVAVWMTRRVWYRSVAVGAIAFIIMLAVPALRFTAGAMLVNVFGYFIDVSPIHFFDLVPAPGGGWMREHSLVKGLVQCCPFVVCAFALRPSFSGPNRAYTLLFSAVIGLAVNVAIFACFNGGIALGFPYLFSRYALYVAPILVVLATCRVSSLHFSRRTIVVCTLLAICVAIFFLQDSVDEESLLRRTVLLRVTLGVAVVALLTLLLQRWPRAERLQAPAVAVAAALSIAVSMGVDNQVSIRNARHFDRALERLESIAPKRFAFVGWGANIDIVLSLRAERDIMYLDFWEAADWSGFRQLLDFWAAEGRPVYGMFTETFRWPYADWDVPAQQVDTKYHYWRIGPPRRRVNDPL